MSTCQPASLSPVCMINLRENVTSVWDEHISGNQQMFSPNLPDFDICAPWIVCIQNWNSNQWNRKTDRKWYLLLNLFKLLDPLGCGNWFGLVQLNFFPLSDISKLGHIYYINRRKGEKTNHSISEVSDGLLIHRNKL